MAKNVNDRGLIENRYGVIEQRASTNAGKMERRIMEEQSDRWEDGFSGLQTSSPLCSHHLVLFHCPFNVRRDDTLNCSSCSSSIDSKSTVGAGPSHTISPMISPKRIPASRKTADVQTANGNGDILATHQSDRLPSRRRRADTACDSRPVAARTTRPWHCCGVDANHAK